MGGCTQMALEKKTSPLYIKCGINCCFPDVTVMLKQEKLRSTEEN